MNNKKLDPECLYSIYSFHNCNVCFWYGIDYLCDENCSKRLRTKEIEINRKRADDK